MSVLADLKESLTTAEPLTLEAYARRHGLITAADVSSHVHAVLGNDCLLSGAAKRRWFRAYDALAAQADATEIAYRAEIAAGRIVDPKAAGNAVERLIERARGHEDRADTQAARRLLAKRGVEWSGA